MKTLYTAEALASGDGRDGNARTNDGKLDVALASPVELGGPYSNATRGTMTVDIKILEFAA